MLHDRIDEFHLIDIKNEVHPSIFINHSDYDIFILRLPKKGINNTLEVTSYAYVVMQETYFKYSKEKNSFFKFNDIEEFHKSLNGKVDIAVKLTYEIFSSIESMEDDFYENKNILDFNQKWFSYKNELIRINRILEKAIEALKKFIANYKNREDFLHIHFSDLLEHLERTSRNSLHALEKLDALYNFYVSNSNEKMNKTVYLLTVLSGVFLPLNLVVGFFGMNTTSLPLTKEEFGTYYVVGILFVIVIILFIITNFLQRFYTKFLR